MKSCACMYLHLPHPSASPPKLYVIFLYCEVNHVPIMACDCNHLLLFVWSLIDKHLSLLWLCNYYSLNTTVSWLVNRKIIELHITQTKEEEPSNPCCTKYGRCHAHVRRMQKTSVSFQRPLSISDTTAGHTERPGIPTSMAGRCQRKNFTVSTNSPFLGMYMQQKCLNIPNKHVGTLQSIAIHDSVTVKRLWVRVPACCVWPNFFTSLHLWKRDGNRKLLHRITSIKWGNGWRTLDEACYNVTLTKCSWNSQVRWD